MATQIVIESAFVEAWNKNTEQHPAWGMKTADTHSKKDEAGKYQTVGRTFRTIKVGRDSGIDLTQFVKGERVAIWGREVTEEREYDGKKFYDLVVWADRVERAGVGGASNGRNGGSTDRSGTDTGSSVPAPVQEPWGVDVEVPF
jgi:hypothetical protein